MHLKALAPNTPYVLPGMFFMIGSDCQKYFTLKLAPGKLITTYVYCSWRSGCMIWWSHSAKTSLASANSM